MGTLDFLKGVKDHVIDAATYDLLQRTYELQEENNHQLKEKITFLEEKITAITKENASLTSEVEKLSLLARDADFEIQDGFAFRKRSDGKYANEGYCPNCYVVMSIDGHRYICPKCKYRFMPEVGWPKDIAERLNSDKK